MYLECPCVFVTTSSFLYLRGTLTPSSLFGVVVLLGFYNFVRLDVVHSCAHVLCLCFVLNSTLQLA